MLLSRSKLAGLEGLNLQEFEIGRVGRLGSVGVRKSAEQVGVDL